MHQGLYLVDYTSRAIYSAYLVYVYNIVHLPR